MDSSDDSEYSLSEEDREEDENELTSPGEDDSDSEPEENNDEEIPKLAEEEFKAMPFQDLLKLQKKLGARVYNEAIFGKSKERIPKNESEKSSKKQKLQPASASGISDDDSGPEEITSKRKVPALGMAKTKSNNLSNGPRDPRFDPRQGYFSGSQFRKHYGFINEQRQKELKNLKRKLEAATDEEEAEKLKFVIQRTENQIREFAKLKLQDEKKKSEKEQARQAIQSGKRPFYERKSTKQARALVEKYDKLKEDGKLAKHIDKRKRKVTAKDRKKLDFST